MAAGKLEMAAGAITWDALREQVFPMLDLVREAVTESLNGDAKLFDLMRIELQGRARDRPPAMGPGNALLD